MTTFGAISFDDRILTALRDDLLVVFAGAGVSKGPPSSLPDFEELVCDIARGTGLTPNVPHDRFLGQLDHGKVAVHEIAARLLSPAESSPNALHRDLLRLFQTADRIRVVTTNFDLHFETAANELFGASPAVYSAPALPLGYDFSGIVHVHGALPHTRGMVLTDADFGRAYLTEGWARRFLVDLFRRYTVLFVGYSHDDVVMDYLARALPPDDVAGRFALTEKDGRWELLGIKAIRFQKYEGPDPFRDLYDGVRLLADRAERGALEWQSRLAELGSRVPPTDAEAIGEVEQALREVYTTRFLLKVARDPEWLQWLNARKYLDALFGSDDLGERDSLLSEWVAQHFAIKHHSYVFEILAAHGLRMHLSLWWHIGREFGGTDGQPLEVAVLKRWTTILLASAPRDGDRQILMSLAERCAEQGCTELVLKVFMAMSEPRLTIKPGFAWPDEERDESHSSLQVEYPLRSSHWSLNEVWTKHLEPHCAIVAQALVSRVAQRLEEMHGELSAWDKASRNWDPVSFGRSAIEPHEQDRYPEAVDVLIDAARDSLEWLAENSPVQLEAEVERLITSDAPLLRRLAIHAVTVNPRQSPETRLKWLLDRVGLDERPGRHEVYRAVALSYTDADEPARCSVVDSILAHTEPASEEESAEIRTERWHFRWLSWLIQAKPDCTVAQAALAPIELQYPDWRPSEHPDLLWWSGSAEWVGSESPWSVDQLLAWKPHENLDNLMNFDGGGFDGPSRDGLLANVREACEHNLAWAFALAQALAERRLWRSDLWSALIRGLQESRMEVEEWRESLTLVSNPHLHSTHAGDIANMLFTIVRDGGKPFALELLDQANTIALPIWLALAADEKEEDIDNWLTRAINRPAGVIVEYWICGLSLILNGKVGPVRSMPDDYRRWLTQVVDDETSRGGMGRSVLASQTAFLFGLDRAWASRHIIPLFSDPDQHKFTQAWDGFLVWGRLYPDLVDALMPAFLEALPRLAAGPNDRRREFIKFYAAITVFHVSDPMPEVLPTLFQQASLEDRAAFASQLGFNIRNMQASAKRSLWDTWLHRYWQDRLQGVLAALDEAEIRGMLDWLPQLGDLFPDAVGLAIKFPPVKIEHSHTLFDLRTSPLVTSFPAETAKLLIYLSGCVLGYQVRYLAEIEARLPPLSAELRRRVDEAFALAGVQKLHD